MELKPPYSVPSVAEIHAQVKPGAPTVVSTFTGAGGSTLGFAWAGFRHVWASEFIPEARDVYLRNNPGAVCDARDIRLVDPQEVLDVAGLAVGELDVFEGSPPCASFSTAGNRSKDWGEVKSYSSTKQRTDDLFWEYGRMLRGLRPRAFIAENVKGLVIGHARGYFIDIMKMLADCGYRVETRLIDASWLGVPQKRQRLIFQGVRDDLPGEHAWPKPLPYVYSVADALPYLRDVRWERRADDAPKVVQTVDHIMLGDVRIECEPEAWLTGYASELRWAKVEPGGALLGKGDRKPLGYMRVLDVNDPCPTILQGGGSPGAASLCMPHEPRKLYLGEAKRLQGFPDDFDLSFEGMKNRSGGVRFKLQFERLGRSVPPPMMYRIAKTIREVVLPATYGEPNAQA